MNKRFWTWPIAIYLFLGGLGGGMLFLAGVIHFFVGPSMAIDISQLNPMAGDVMLSINSINIELAQLGYSVTPAYSLALSIIVAVIVLALGCLLLIFELGQPKLFVRAFIAKTAIIKWGAVLLTIAMIGGFVWFLFYLPLEWRESFGFLFWLGDPSWNWARDCAAAIAMVSSLGLMIYTGILLSSLKAKPFWNTPMLPVLFVVSALSTGSALLSLTCGGWPFSMLAVKEAIASQSQDSIVQVINFLLYEDIVKFLHTIDIVFISIEVIVLMLYVLLMFGSSNLTSKRVAASFLYGKRTLAFWGGMVVGGLLLPLFLYIVGAHTLAALWVAPVLVMAAGLLLRFLIVYANDRRGVPGEEKYYDRLPNKDAKILNPYWKQPNSNPSE
jgi:polysulfide reductase chain C